MIEGSRTLGEMLLRGSDAYGNRPAVVISDEILSYRELAQRARAMAGRLLASGLKHGDRIAVWLPNGRVFLELAFGCALAGLVFVPLNTRLRHVDAADALRKSGARALFFTQEFLGTNYFALVESLARGENLPLLEWIVNIDSESSGGILSLSRWMDSVEPDDRLAQVSGEDPVLISFTSGTTSSPKGAVICHRTLLHIASQVGLRMDVTEADRIITAMPFYHNGGFVPTLLTSLLTGCTLYTQPRFDPEYVLDGIARHQCTLVSGVGTMFTMMIDSPAFVRADLRSVRAVRITGPADQRRTLLDRFNHPMIYSLYGMSETTAAVTITSPGDSVEEQVSTNGKPLRGVSIRIADGEGTAVPDGKTGEILIAGDCCLMKGYFGDPEATANVIAPGGWLRSGDLGYVDDRGNLVLVGRIKDMYRSGGENVSCPEVEEFLRMHPAVLQAAILGVPEPRLGEVGLAFVEIRPGNAVTEVELQRYCRKNLANFKVPRIIKFRESIPMTATGKVEKHKLKNEALAIASDMSRLAHGSSRVA